MKPTKSLPTVAGLLALAVLAPAASAASPPPDPPPVFPSDLIKSEQTVQLQSNTTTTLTMPLKGLGQDFNYETPCFGFQVWGPGVDIEAALLAPFGKVVGPLDGNATPADLGAVQQPDGSWEIPDSVGILNDERLRMGVNCAAAGWSWFGSDGQPAIGLHQQMVYPKKRVSAAVARRRAATMRTRAKRLKRIAHQLIGHDAAMGPVTVQVAGMKTVSNFDIRMVLVIKSGELAGPTTVAMHAEVAKQKSLNLPDGDTITGNTIHRR